MPEEHEIDPQGKPREGHAADQALHDDDALNTAEEAHHAEEIGTNENLPPHKRAKMLRKLADEELLALAEQAAKADHWLDVARRGQAELDNTIKRLRRESAEDQRYAQAGIARDLLPVIDNLNRALQAAPPDDPMAEGVKLTARLLIEALAKHAITPIEALGKPFDPAFHEALMTTHRADLPDNAVAMELEQGWKMHDRVLRATKVQVNKL
jgi:molecular chaperone GrpE